MQPASANGRSYMKAFNKISVSKNFGEEKYEK